MGAPRIGKLVKKNVIGDTKVGKVGNTVRFGQDEYTKPEQDAMLAGAGEEDKFIKCSDDITGKDLLWQAVKQARDQVNLACMKRSMSTQLWQSTT